MFCFVNMITLSTSYKYFLKLVLVTPNKENAPKKVMTKFKMF